MEIHLVGADFFNVDTQTDWPHDRRMEGQIEIMKTITIFASPFEKPLKLKMSYRVSHDHSTVIAILTQ
jgi:hypothetical protein